MKMRIIVLGILLTCMSLPALASERVLSSWQSATVQVNSFPCLTERPRFSGSGLLISFEGQIWVLTSEHVVIQDKSVATCQETAGSFGTAKLELIAADFQKGLALLRVSNASAAVRDVAIPLSELRVGQSVSASLVALGFPAGSDQLQTLSGGKLLNSESRRALISGVPLMIEAGNLPVEYGMSGGVLLSEGTSGFAFRGILSHQVLRRETGKPSSADDRKSGDSASSSDLTLAIPDGDALAWFLSAASASDKSYWQRNPVAQKNGLEAVQFGPLLFSLKQKNAKDTWEIGGADGSGIGGSDGSGIGGGGNEKGAGEELFTVEVTFNQNADSNLKSKPMTDPSLEQWRNWLLSGRKVEAVFLRNADAKRLMKIGSLAQFFTFWFRDHFTPLAVRSKAGDLHSDSEQLIRLASVAASLSQSARDKATSSDTKAWFSLLRDTALLAENGLTSSADLLGVLTGANDLYWRQYYDEEFDAAVALEGSLQKLASQLKKMGL